MRKVVSCILCMSIMFVMLCSPIAFANEESNKYISTYGASASLPSSGTLRIEFLVLGTGLMSSIGASTIVIYKNGAAYYTFYSSNPAYNAKMVKYNAYYNIDGYVTFPVSAGNTYYAEVTFFATDSTGTGTEACFTNSVTV